MLPPKAAKIEFIHQHHNDKRVDYYNWLKDPNILSSKNQKIMEHLNKEKNYAQNFFDQDKNLQEALFNELKGRIKLEDHTVPIQYDNYCYYAKIEANQNYYAHFRYHQNNPSQHKLLLDENELAAGKEFFSLGELSISHDHELMAYTTDVCGNERYSLSIKNLEDNKLLDDSIDNTIGSVVWSNDNQGFFYIILDQAWRPYQVKYHLLGSKNSQDKIIFTENDEKFFVNIDQSSDKKYLVIYSESKTASEIYFLSLDRYDNSLVKFYDRKCNHLIHLDHGNNEFYALINDTGRNFRLIRTQNHLIDQKDWVEIIPATNETYLNTFMLYHGFIAVQAKINGINHLKYSQYNDFNWLEIKLNQAVYSAKLSQTSYHIAKIRFNYSALNTPLLVMEFDLHTHKLDTLKQVEIPSGFNSELYRVERIFAPSSDGVMVPISLLYKKELFKKDGSNPLYLYGYGSYGIGIDPGFNTNIISLVDRGFVYAIAHIRGGDDLGFEWYEQAKFLTKKRTFEDFIAAAQYLVNQNYTKAGNIAIMGGSAGGMLVGACLNMHPQLFKAVIAHVPFVDVLNTMLDDTLPLTTAEYLEWGNPTNQEFYDYIKSYSPYDNLKSGIFPNLYATTSLGDTRVAYWEPAKWIAQIREINQGNSIILFDINLNAGHGGASGRFETLKEKAKEYSFILKTFNLN
ncbi:S9 family peptidase [Rickettsiales endosymbiont of Stachyamoeba lipophora]|uniref:S9 family peptidase n=1 Tax=Rickettsiales endosymbiont of Stachyamoeba lipophora TaxID=2486578 RepID=UPI000F655B43|nr:S9 family peptidase [Rickettsiales endosymbiont of Stachyamoeba lipophora]AZL16261.1 S9 family peptidase [Rickettsiales endosymbiont of Stachyamoeba lipophora]